MPARANRRSRERERRKHRYDEEEETSPFDDIVAGTHKLLKKHATLVRRMTQRLGLDRGSLFLEEEIRRLKYHLRKGTMPDSEDNVRNVRREEARWGERKRNSFEERDTFEGESPMRRTFSGKYSAAVEGRRSRESMRNTYPPTGDGEDEETEPMMCGSPKRAAQALRRRRKANKKTVRSSHSVSEAVFGEQETKVQDLVAQGGSMLKQHQWRAASACFDEAIDACSKVLAAAHIDRSGARCKLREFEEAASDAEFALSLLPGSATAHFRHAAALLGMGKDFDAYQEFSKAAAIDRSVLSTGSDGARLGNISIEELESVLSDMQRISSSKAESRGGDTKFADATSPSNKVHTVSEYVEVPAHRRDEPMVFGSAATKSYEPRGTSAVVAHSFDTSVASGLRSTAHSQIGATSTPLRGSSRTPYHEVAVTFVAGFAGAGKTTLVRYLVQASGNSPRTAILAPGAVNIEKSAVATRLHDGGPVHIALRDATGDLLAAEAAKVGMTGRFDRIIVELPSTAEPLPAASDFYAQQEASQRESYKEGGSAPVVAMRLDAIVCVVDSVNFASDFTSGKGLAEMSSEIPGVDASDERLLSELLVRQVEAANVVVLNKSDAAADAHRLVMLEHTLQHLNPRAHLIRCEHGQLDPSMVLDTKLFDPSRPQDNAGWMQIMQGRHTKDLHVPMDTTNGHVVRSLNGEPEGVCSFVFRARRPFHAQRLHAVIVGGVMAGVVRSKGFLWIAQEPRFALEWSGASGSITLTLSAVWEVAAGRNPDNGASADASAVWDEHWGDRKTELVFVAARCSDRPKIYRELNAALLTDQELKRDLNFWGSQTTAPLDSVTASAANIFRHHPGVSRR